MTSNSALSGRDQISLAKSLVDILKVSAGFDKEANVLAGRLEHRIYDQCSTQTIWQYLTTFRDVLDPDVVSFIEYYEEELNDQCSLFKNGEDYERLVSTGILSAKRLFDTYVLRKETGSDTVVYESISHFYMRIAIFCTCKCLEHDYLRSTISQIQALDWTESVSTPMELFLYFYKPLTQQLVCCSTPIMRSGGLRDGHLASCFIMSPELYSETDTTHALFSELSPLLAAKSGVGIDMTRFSQTKNINSCLKLINYQVEYFNDSNQRPVSVAAYIEPWHYQILEFLSSKLPERQDRVASIFQGLCLPGLFFETYLKDPTETWYLFDPKNAGNLSSLYGDKFDAEYARLVEAEAYCGKIPIKSLMFSIINTIIKTGTPYIIIKDACNKHHWFDTQGGAITAANLCAEVIQCPGNAVSTCNLANVCLPKCLVPTEFTGDGDGWPTVSDKSAAKWLSVSFSMDRLHRAVQVSTFVVNCAILGGMCPTKSMEIGQCERSMGLGIQGLADVFMAMGLDYRDQQAEDLDVSIFENMYYKALETSHRIVALGGGKPFAGWEKSKLHSGVFHWEEWGNVVNTIPIEKWDKLRDSIMANGVFNCQYIALMPTAGSSQITGHSESYYPIYANSSSKVSNKEELMRPNVMFLKHLSAVDAKAARFYGGDVSKFPEHLKIKYKNFLSAFDYCPYMQLRRARARAPFVDQSQSHSFFLKEENVKSARYVKDLLVAGYKMGLKTVMYYCRVQKESNLSALECLEKPTGDVKNCTIIMPETNLDERAWPVNGNKFLCTDGGEGALLGDCLSCQ